MCFVVCSKLTFPYGKLQPAKHEKHHCQNLIKPVVYCSLCVTICGKVKKYGPEPLRLQGFCHVLSIVSPLFEKPLNSLIKLRFWRLRYSTNAHSLGIAQPL